MEVREESLEARGMYDGLEGLTRVMRRSLESECEAVEVDLRVR